MPQSGSIGCHAAGSSSRLAEVLARGIETGIDEMEKAAADSRAR
jgi:hypothetical protein